MRLRLRVCDFVEKIDKLPDRHQKARCVRKQPPKIRVFLFDNTQKNIKKMTIKV